MAKNRNRSLKAHLTLSTAAMAAMASSSALRAATIVSGWDFQNYPVVASEVSPVSDLGAVNGSAFSLGMTNSYGTPGNSTALDDIVKASAGGSDPSSPNNEWRIRGQSGGNGWSTLAPIGSQGAQFNASTVGFTNITVSFDLERSSTSALSKIQVEYTTDGSNWLNAPLTYAANPSLIQTNSSSSNTVIGSYLQMDSSATVFFTGITADLTGIAGVNNNSNFGLRLVNAATGADAVNGLGAAYNNSSGNWRFDEVLINAGLASGTNIVPSPALLTWAPGSSNWNTATANTNWLNTNGATVAFKAGSNANFTGAGISNGTAIINVDLGGVTAGAINMSHTNGTYTIVGGAITSGAFTKTGAGNLVISSAQNFSALKIQGGTLHATADNQLGTSTAVLTLEGGSTFFADAPMTLARSVTIGTNGAGATINTGANNITIGGVLSVNGTFTKAGTGDLTFGSAITSNAGGSLNLPANSGNFHFAGTSGSNAFIAPSAPGGINGNLYVDGNARLQFQGGYVDGTGTIFVRATNTAIIATIQNGTTNSGTVTNINMPIVFNPDNLPNFVGTFGESQTNNTMIVMSKTVLSGNASIHFANQPYFGGGGGGQGTMEIYSQSTYTGDTILDNANFAVERLHVDNIFPVGTNLIFGTGTNNTASVGGVDLNGFNQTFASLKADSSTLVNLFGTSKVQVVAGIFNTGANNSILTVSGSATTTFAAPIGNPAANGNITSAANAIELHLAASNTGALILQGDNQYVGGTVIDGGTLQIDASPFSIRGVSLPINAEVTNNARLIINTSGQNGATVTANDIVGTGTTTVTAQGVLAVANMTQASLVNQGATTINTSGSITAVSGTGALSIGSGNPAAVLVGSFAQGSVTVSDQSTLNVAVTTPHVTNTTTSLTLNGSGTLNVANSSVVVNYGVGNASPASSILTAIINATNGTGGITSSLLASHPGTAIGYVDANDNAPTGTNVLAGTVKFGYALQGDTGLRGTVDLQDYLQLASHFHEVSSARWSDGDFNYDGHVDLQDYLLLAKNFHGTASPSIKSAAVSATLTGRSAQPAVAVPAGLVNPGVGQLALEVDPTNGHVYLVGNNTQVQAYNADSAGGLFNIAAGKNPYETLKINPNDQASWNVLQAVPQHIAENVTTGTSSEPFAAFGSATGNYYFDLTLPGSTLWNGTSAQVNTDLAFDWGDGNLAHHTGQVINLVPEPTTLSVIGLCGMGLLARRRRQVASC